MFKNLVTLSSMILMLAIPSGVLFAQEEHKHHSERSREVEEANKAYDKAWIEWQKEFAASEYFLPGMVVGEIGAGKGELTALIAQRVGPKGHVYSNEIDKKLGKQIDGLCQSLGLENVTTILGEVADPRFPRDRIDVAVMVEVFHHLEKPEEFMKAALGQLKPGARFVIVEPDIKQPWGLLENGCYSDPVKTRALAEKAGYEFAGQEKLLIHDMTFYILLLRVPSE